MYLWAQETPSSSVRNYRSTRPPSSRSLQELPKVLSMTERDLTVARRGILPLKTLRAEPTTPLTWAPPACVGGTVRGSRVECLGSGRSTVRGIQREACSPNSYHNVSVGVDFPWFQRWALTSFISICLSVCLDLLFVCCYGR